MDMSRKISLSSSSASSIESLSSVGTKNGCKTVLCQPLTTLQMTESGAKSSESWPSLTKTEGRDSQNDLQNSGGNINTSISASTMADVRSSAHTIPVGTSSATKENTTADSIPSDDKSIGTTANTVTCSKSTDNSDLKRSKNEAKYIDHITDAIADIAASSRIQSRRKKRERTESTTSPQLINHMPTLNHPPKIVTASMSNHYVPPRLQIGIGSLKKFKSSDKNLADSNTNPENKISVHMLNSVGLECGDDGTLLLERFDDDDHGSMCANDPERARPVKKEDEIMADTITASCKIKKPLSWTLDQHRAFAAAIFEIGLKNCSPSIIMENMRKQPRYITRERTKSHLQKYRQTKQRSKGEFLKEFDAFFESTEEAKVLLNSNSSNKNLERKEPFTKAILTTALEGKKPSKLLGGKAAALLSYSVFNGFSTSHGPDQLQYKAAKLTEFPSLTEEEKRSSVGASLLQVKTLIDNMTDVLLKTRHGIKPFPVGKSVTGDDESVSSSSCSSDEGYSDEEDDAMEGGGRVDKNLMGKGGSKDQDPTAVPPAVPKPGGMFPMGAVPGAPTNPLYRPPPTAYPAPFPAQGAPPPPVPTGFPPPQYPQAHPPFYGGAHPPPHLQPGAAPTFGAPAGFHPQMHYPQDPRINPYQQPPPTQVGPYPGVPPMQPNYYPPVPGYPSYYGGTNESNIPPVANNSVADYPPGDVYANQSRQGGGEHRQRSESYSERSPSYSNDGRSDRISYDIDEDPIDKRSRRRAEKRSKHRRRRSDRAESSLLMETSERSDGNDFGDFLDRLSKVPSPSKSSQKPSSSPVQRSRHHGSLKQDSQMEKRERKRSHYQAAFDTPAESNSYTKNYGSPDDQFSEAGVRSLASTYEASPVRRAPSDRSQRQAHDDQQRQADNNGQFWESSNFEEASYNNQQHPHSSAGVSFDQQSAQLDAYGSGTEHQQHQFLKSGQSSPDDGSKHNYFFGE